MRYPHARPLVIFSGALCVLALGAFCVRSTERVAFGSTAEPERVSADPLQPERLKVSEMPAAEQEQCEADADTVEALLHATLLTTCVLDGPAWPHFGVRALPTFRAAEREAKPQSLSFFGKLTITGNGILTLPDREGGGKEGGEGWRLSCGALGARTLYGPSTYAVIGGHLFPLAGALSGELSTPAGGPPERLPIFVPPMTVLHLDTDIRYIQTETSTMVLVVSGRARIIAPGAECLREELGPGEGVEIRRGVAQDGLTPRSPGEEQPMSPSRRERWYVERLRSPRAEAHFRFLEASVNRSRGEPPPSPLEASLLEGRVEAAARVALGMPAADPDRPRALYRAALSAWAAGRSDMASEVSAELRAVYPASTWAREPSLPLARVSP